ncbi:MAG: DivIVA domain-containing protein [Eggerthellaceae bacterium]|nr:DivIVA domain-containing protein [Eggerthellaceae bacterium]
MAITAADIQNVSFSIDRKGYDVDEVDVFLEHVADEIDALNRLIADLESQLANGAADDAQPAEDAEPAEDFAAADSAEVAGLQARIAELESQLSEKSANDNAISQALIVAQRSADEVLANARTEASNIIKDADEEADRIIGKAEADRLRIAESIRSLETDRSDVRAEYREMLANFMADAQKKLAEIDGDARRAAASAQARNDAGAANYAPAAAAAAAPAAVEGAAPVAAVAPAASGYIDKDFSGYGDADAGFEFDID